MGRAIHLKSYKRRIDKLQQMLSGEGMQIKDVAAALFLARITTNQLLLELEREGMIHIAGYTQDGTGRPSGIYRWGRGGERPPSPGPTPYQHKRKITKLPSVPVDIAQQLSMQRIVAGLGSRKSSPNTNME